MERKVTRVSNLHRVIFHPSAGNSGAFKIASTMVEAKAMGRVSAYLLRAMRPSSFWRETIFEMGSKQQVAIIIYLVILFVPLISFFMLKPFMALSFINRGLIGLGLLVAVLLSQLNKYHEWVYAGTNIHIPILWALAYLLCWFCILSISNRIAKIAIVTTAVFSHVALGFSAALPGVWIIGDLSRFSEVIFMDKRIKAYQTGWGNFSHNGIDIHVVRRGSLMQRVLFHQRIQGPYPKDKVISIQSDDEFIYRIFKNKTEIKTILIP